MEILNSALMVTDERDFIAGGNVDIDSLPDINGDIHDLNQLEFKDQYGNCLCTVYGPEGVLLDNTTIELTEAQRNELAGLRYNAPDFDPKVGGYLSEGVNITRNYAKSLGYKISSVSIESSSDQLFTLLNKGYRINIGIYIKEKYLEESQDDGILEVGDLGDKKYGHSTGLRKIGEDYYIIDNYKGVLEFNRVKLEDLSEMIDNGTIFNWAYVLFTDDLDLIPNTKKKIMEEITLESAKRALENGFWNGENPQKPLSREEGAAIQQRVYEKLKAELNLT